MRSRRQLPKAFIQGRRYQVQNLCTSRGQFRAKKHIKYLNHAGLETFELGGGNHLHGLRINNARPGQTQITRFGGHKGGPSDPVSPTFRIVKPDPLLWTKDSATATKPEQVPW